MLPEAIERNEKDAQKLSISLHPKPTAVELNLDGSQVGAALDREEKVETTMDQPKSGQDPGVVTGQVQLEHGQAAPPNIDQTNEDFTHGDFKDPAQNRFFGVQQAQQQPNLQH